MTSAQAPKVLLSGPGALHKGQPQASTRTAHAQPQASAAAGSYDGQGRAGAQVAQATPSAWGDPRRAEQQKDTTAFSEGRIPEGDSTQPQQSFAAARSSQSAWPAAQSHQARGAKGGNTSNFGRGSNRNFNNKGQQLASRGFNAPIQITRMSWGEPLPNAQDTWGDDEAEPQPLPSAMPAEGKPSYRRNIQPAPSFPPIAEDTPDAQASDTPTSTSAQHSFQTAPAKPTVTMNWTRMWTTDSLDHTDDEIRACLHLSSMPDLVDDNGGAGESTYD